MTAGSPPDREREDRSHVDPALARKRAEGLAVGSEIPFSRPQRAPASSRIWVPIVLVALAAAIGIAIAVWPRDEATAPTVYVIDAAPPDAASDAAP